MTTTLKQPAIFANHWLLWRRMVWHTSRWFYGINDYLQSPSLENSSARTVRSGLELTRKNIPLNVNISSYCHRNKSTPASLTRIPRVNECVWGEEGPENTARSTGVVAARLKNEWKTFFLCLLLMPFSQHSLSIPTEMFWPALTSRF